MRKSAEAFGALRSPAGLSNHMLAGYAHSPNLSIPKRPVVEESHTAKEETLVAAAMRGCSAAFGELCQPYTKRLLTTIQRITRNREDAEDALQDSFLRAFVHIKDFDGRSKFSTWLTRIAINSALMIIRRLRNFPQLSVSDDKTHGILEISDCLPDPEASCAQRELESIFLTALEDLRPPFGKCFNCVTCKSVRWLRPHGLWTFLSERLRGAFFMPAPPFVIQLC